MTDFKVKMPLIATIFSVFALVSGVLMPNLASAAGAAPVSGEKLIEGARLCTQRFPVEEQRNSIPTHLLAAIATTESGRWHEGLGMNVPWPWTINVEGKGYFFNSKAEAIAQTQHLINQGHRSIDVGCMQVNIKHHAKAFANLNQAFDPEANVAYAAKFLHDNYADLGDWIKATAAYHSRTAYYGNQYLVEIERSWNRIVAKVAAARASQNGGVTTAALGAGNESEAPEQVASNASSRPVTSGPSLKPISGAHHIKSIAVRDDHHGPGVLIIRPQSTAQAQPVTLADAVPATATTIPANGDTVRRVALDSAGHTRQPASDRSSSQFVFSN